ncbi:hypothetical protein EYZ11_013552 [Aspergillus tanneri]|uniref:Uncharacterized protein n=1 Tax=Aspergillus tanneri TaxID=1220188 RepID=A0A4S3IXW7_9EURO|nr:hypothetical protein EYZ11_013552 [Aspergillus tanneri]
MQLGLGETVPVGQNFLFIRRSEFSTNLRHISPVPVATAMASLTPDDYTMAWICALPLEAAAARAMLDEAHNPTSTAN